MQYLLSDTVLKHSHLFPQKGISWSSPLQNPSVLQTLTIYLPRAPEDENEVLLSTFTNGH